MGQTRRKLKAKGARNQLQRTARLQPDVTMRESVQEKGISKKKPDIKKTPRKNANKHIVKGNSAPSRVKTFKQAANKIETDFLREGKNNLNRLFYGKTSKGIMNYDEYDLLKKDIVSEYAKIQLQQLQEISKLSTELRIVEKTKDEFISKITKLQDEVNLDKSNTGIDDLLSGFNKL